LRHVDERKRFEPQGLRRSFMKGTLELSQFPNRFGQKLCGAV